MSLKDCRDLDMRNGCKSSVEGFHLYNAHGQCQWCHQSSDTIELEKRREAMKWHKWPEEKPNRNEFYTVRIGHLLDKDEIKCLTGYEIINFNKHQELDFKPVGTIPGKTTSEGAK